MIAGMRGWPGVVVLASAVLGAQTAPHLPPLDKVAAATRRGHLPRRRAARRPDAAMAIVTPMAPLWRLAGNPQFDQSLEWIAAPLTAAGIATRYDTIA